GVTRGRAGDDPGNEAAADAAAQPEIAGVPDLDAEERRAADVHLLGHAPRDDLLDQRDGAVDRDRVAVGRSGRLEGEADRRGRVDADHALRAVVERPAGVARLEAGVRLDQAGQLLGAVLFVARGDRSAETGDRAGRAREGAGAACVARGGHTLADVQR